MHTSVYCLLTVWQVLSLYSDSFDPHNSPAVLML